ncbi:MAG: hypothetical protein JO022_06120 [Acidobacteriaceae bacterium]|nr:hypothetical protein [Acidobacteriaceae bacterium]
MKSKNESKIDVPDMAQLAELYRKARERSDHQLASVAESAAAKFAAGEAALLEAQILYDFASETAEPSAADS